MKALWLSAALSLGIAPALAQEVPLDETLIRQCLRGGGDAQCIGVAVEPCIAGLGGYSTVAHQACARAELAWWDGLLNEAYGTAMARARDSDAANATEIRASVRPSDADALRRMQRAWIAFRDAACGYEALQWWGGTGASGAEAECLMRMTGEQALALQGFARER